MEKAIKKAIEGGYKNVMSGVGIIQSFDLKDHPYKENLTNIYVLDPLFWQALGKSLGWEKKDEEKQHLVKLSGGNVMPLGMYEWNKKWHRFIDHLVEGKDAESFFNELLK